MSYIKKEEAYNGKKLESRVCPYCFSGEFKDYYADIEEYAYICHSECSSCGKKWQEWYEFLFKNKIITNLKDMTCSSCSSSDLELDETGIEDDRVFVYYCCNPCGETTERLYDLVFKGIIID